MTDEEKSTKEKREAFIREAVGGGAAGRKKIIGKIFLTLGLALIFGVVAALSFAVTQKLFGNDAEDAASESITIFSSDDPAASTAPTASAVSPESDIETQPHSETETVGIWEEIYPRVHSEAEKVYDNNTGRNAQYALWQKAAATAEASLVTVTSQSERTDIFGNVVSNAIERTGVIIARTDKEYLILTYSDITAGGEIFVTFAGEEEMTASLKATDNVFGIAVVAVNIYSLSASSRELAPIHFANVSSAKGSPVIAVGMPQGKSSSVLYGMLSYVNSTIPGTDDMVKLFQTDISSSNGTNGILINTNGEMLAWITDRYSNYSVSGRIAALSLNDMKLSIEKLSNAKYAALLGIRGQVVTQELSSRNSIPMGLYVSALIEGRAAEEAGIMSGDVIVEIDGSAAETFAELNSILARHEPGDTVSVKLLRANREEFEEMNIKVILQSR